MRTAPMFAIPDGTSTRARRLFRATACVLIGGFLAASTGCQSNPDPGGPSGGPVAGALDNHCQSRIQPTNASSCKPTFDMATSGTADMGAGEESEYGETQFNAEGNDDDCKYLVKYSVTPVRKGVAATFTATLTSLATNKPVTGANVRAEVFLSDTHPAPNTGADTTESSPGTYVIGPVQFDEPGKWTVRYHYFEECVESLEDSPHGHIAFYVNVP